MELGYGKILSIELNFAQICTRFFFKKINFFLTFIPKFNSNICFKGLIFFFSLDTMKKLIQMKAVES